eukprot:SAG31_NODE_10551_length_1125_cov_3.052632_2_plen_48_part_01
MTFKLTTLVQHKICSVSLLTRVCGAAATLRDGRDKGAEFIEDVMPKTL